MFFFQIYFRFFSFSVNIIIYKVFFCFRCTTTREYMIYSSESLRSQAYVIKYLLNIYIYIYITFQYLLFVVMFFIYEFYSSNFLKIWLIFIVRHIYFTGFSNMSTIQRATLPRIFKVLLVFQYFQFMKHYTFIKDSVDYKQNILANCHKR
jgi:hypothetical protein